MRIAAFRAELEREMVMYALSDGDNPLTPSYSDDRYHNVLVRMGDRANLHLWGLDRTFVRVSHRILSRAYVLYAGTRALLEPGIDGRMRVQVLPGYEESAAGVRLVNCDVPSVSLVLRARAMALHVCEGDIIDAE